MKKTIKGAAELGGVLLVLTGLMIYMCDTVDLDKQIVTIVVGLVIFLAGAGIVTLAKRGEEDALCSR